MPPSCYTENLFGLWVAQDLDEPTRYVPFLLQGGLVMPDRDYYLDPSAKMAEIRTRYQAHVVAVLNARAAAGRAREGRPHLRPRAAYRRGARDARAVGGRPQG